MIPGMRLRGLIDYSLSAVASVIPGIRSRRLLLKESLRIRRRHIVFAAYCAARGLGIIEEKFIIPCRDLAHNPAAACLVCRFCGYTDDTGIREIRAFGKAAADLSESVRRVVGFVLRKSDGCREAAHRMSCYADDPVAVRVFQNIRLIIDILHSIIDRICPECTPQAEEIRPRILVAIDSGMSVVIHIDVEYDVPSP